MKFYEFIKEKPLIKEKEARTATGVVDHFSLVLIEEIDREKTGLKGLIHFDFRDILKVEHLANLVYFVQVVQTRDAIWVIDCDSVRKLSTGSGAIPLPMQHGNFNSIFWI